MKRNQAERSLTAAVWPEGRGREEGKKEGRTWEGGKEGRVEWGGRKEGRK